MTDEITIKTDELPTDTLPDTVDEKSVVNEESLENSHLWAIIGDDDAEKLAELDPLPTERYDGIPIIVWCVLLDSRDCFEYFVRRRSVSLRDVYPTEIGTISYDFELWHYITGPKMVASILHHSAWRPEPKAIYGVNPLFMICYERDELIEVMDWVTLPFGEHLPFCARAKQGDFGENFAEMNTLDRWRGYMRYHREYPHISFI